MAELADAADSKSAGLRPLGVRLPLPAPSERHYVDLDFVFPGTCYESIALLTGNSSRIKNALIIQARPACLTEPVTPACIMKYERLIVS